MTISLALRKRWRWAVAILILLLAYGFFAWIIFVFRDPPPHYDHVSWPEKQWVVERHRYHGITVSIEENGVHYFYRNGERCRL